MSILGKISENDIHHAVRVLKQGGVVVFPTETAYGLAADARSATAVARVLLIKRRSAGNPLPLLAANREMVEQIAEIPQKLGVLADMHWPGPLTLELKLRDTGLALRFLERGIAGIRVSSHLVAQSLSGELGAPIVSTSANLSGMPTCFRVEDVKKQFEGKENTPDYYLDAGRLEPERPSTIVGLDEKGEVIVFRQGKIEI